MAVQDSQLVQWLEHEQVSIRSASLDLLSSSYSTNHRWCTGVFHAWDRFCPQNAFPEFPLLAHLEIASELVGECVQRAGAMSQGKAIIDRGCRCAGKLIEAVSVSSPKNFLDHLESIDTLKKQSKIFFRVDLDRMRYRAEHFLRDQFDPLDEWFTKEVEPTLPYGLYPHIESSFLRGQADDALRLGFGQLASDNRKSHVLEGCFELASRYRLLGYETFFADGLNDEDSSIADASAIALSRCRNDHVLSLIAERFAGYTRSGQLRSIDVLRRSRLPKTPQLLRFLRGPALDGSVQNALRVAEVLQFDFSELEEWLESLMVMDDPSIARVQPLLSLVGPLSESLASDDRARTLHLVKTRLSS